MALCILHPKLAIFQFQNEHVWLVVEAAHLLCLEASQDQFQPIGAGAEDLCCHHFVQDDQVTCGVFNFAWRNGNFRLV